MDSKPRGKEPVGNVQFGLALLSMAEEGLWEQVKNRNNMEMIGRARRFRGDGDAQKPVNAFVGSANRRTAVRFIEASCQQLDPLSHFGLHLLWLSTGSP